MKKRLLILLVVALLPVLAACMSTAKPSAAVKGFMEAAQTFDLAKMQQFVTSGNMGDVQTMMSITDDPLMTGFRDYFKANAAKISYTIKETTITGDTATVAVACKYVDSTAFAKDAVKELLVESIKDAMAGTQVSRADMGQRLSTIVAAKQKSAETVFTEATITIPCIKIDGKWYVAKVDENLVNVVMSNFLKATENLQKVMGS